MSASPAQPTKAMVLAAGLGTRLRPLTDTRPKALVEINGRTLLEITLARLRRYGVRDVIINVHHFADMVVDYVAAHANFGMNITFSREDNLLLDTGGGLKKAAWFFDGSSAPFVLHNVDIVSNIDLGAMLQFHSENDALATLAVQARPTSRYLLFDQHLQLCGRRTKDAEPEIVHPAPDLQPLAFSGIHIISPRLLPMIQGDGAFSIIATYLELAARRERILAFRADNYFWRDLGTPASLEKAAAELTSLADSEL